MPGLNLNALNFCLTLTFCVCIQEYKLSSYEKKIRFKSQKVSEILRLENFMDLKFRLDLTHKNGSNLLSFLDTGLIIWIYYVCINHYLATLVL